MKRWAVTLPGDLIDLHKRASELAHRQSRQLVELVRRESFLSGDEMRFEDKIRAAALVYPLSVTSWIRSKSRNEALGGVSDSRHLAGLAVDVVLDSALDGAGFQSLCVALDLQVISESDHFHVQEPRGHGMVLSGK